MTLDLPLSAASLPITQSNRVSTFVSWKWRASLLLKRYSVRFFYLGIARRPIGELVTHTLSLLLSNVEKKSSITNSCLRSQVELNGKERIASRSKKFGLASNVCRREKKNRHRLLCFLTILNGQIYMIAMFALSVLFFATLISLHDDDDRHTDTSTPHASVVASAKDSE